MLIPDYPSTIPTRRKQQQGSILLTSLLFLIVVTLITLAATDNILMQSRMNSYTEDEDLALQSAEAALLAGENRIRQMTAAEFDAAFSVAGNGEGGSIQGFYEGSTCTAADADCYVNLVSQLHTEAAWANAVRVNTIGCSIEADADCRLSGDYLIIRLGQLQVTNDGQARLEAITNQYQAQGEGADAEVWKYQVVARSSGNRETTRKVLVSYFAQTRPRF